MEKVTSVDAFLKMVFKKTFNANKEEEDPFNKFWFRGENSDYKETSLIPSAYRDFVVNVNTAKKEKTICQK
ncbi:MAG: hypothetical protein M0R23_02145 [Bacteroidales bacterium]|nr:hypothetical protein [Bacteroidales bacterium]